MKKKRPVTYAKTHPWIKPRLTITEFANEHEAVGHPAGCTHALQTLLESSDEETSGTLLMTKLASIGLGSLMHMQMFV